MTEPSGWLFGTPVASPVPARPASWAAAVRRGWWLLVLCAAVSGLVAQARASDRPATYESTARLVLGPAPLPEPADVADTSAGLDAGPAVATFAEVLTSANIAASAAAQPALGAVEIGAYAAEAAPLLSANVVELTVRGPDPRGAQLIAKALSDRAGRYFEALYPVYRVSELAPAAFEGRRISPDRPRAGALGVLAGACLGSAAALLLWGRRPIGRLPIPEDVVWLHADGRRPGAGPRSSLPPR